MYQLAYDALNEGQPLIHYILVLFWLIPVVGCIKVNGNLITWESQPLKRFLICWLLFGIPIFSYVFFKQAQCVEWRNSGNYTITEGIVSEYKPMSSPGRGSESFRLGEYRFSYSNSHISRGCFNDAKMHGGPIDSGKKVKLYHNEGTILRVEVWN